MQNAKVFGAGTVNKQYTDMITSKKEVAQNAKDNCTQDKILKEFKHLGTFVKYLDLHL